MKENYHESNFNNNFSSSISSKKGQKDLFNNINILCSNNEKGRYYCNQCNQQAVLCDKSQCQCTQKHQECQYFQRITTFHSHLNSRLFQKKDIEQVTEMTNKMIDEISDLEQLIQKQYNYFGLTQAEENVVKVIQLLGEGKASNSIGFQKFKKVRQIQQNWFQYSISKFESLLKNSKSKILSFYDDLERRISIEHVKYNTLQNDLEDLSPQISTNRENSSQQLQQIFFAKSSKQSNQRKNRKQKEKKKQTINQTSSLNLQQAASSQSKTGIKEFTDTEKFNQSLIDQNRYTQLASINTQSINQSKKPQNRDNMFENSDNMLKLFLELGIDKKKVFNLGYLLKETKPLY